MKIISDDRITYIVTTHKCSWMKVNAFNFLIYNNIGALVKILTQGVYITQLAYHWIRKRLIVYSAPNYWQNPYWSADIVSILTC